MWKRELHLGFRSEAYDAIIIDGFKYEDEWVLPKHSYIGKGWKHHVYNVAETLGTDYKILIDLTDPITFTYALYRLKDRDDRQQKLIDIIDKFKEYNE